MFAKPGFRLWIPCCGGSSQASFYLCTLRRVSVPPELTLGPPRYFFKGVPPQPNCPPIVVPTQIVPVRDTDAKGRCSIVAFPNPRRDWSITAPAYALHPQPYPNDRLQ